MSHINEYSLLNEDNITEITLDTNPGKFKTTITNILSKHCSEIKISSDNIIQPINIAKKKLKDLITKHNNEIFSFMSRQDKIPDVLGIAETIFRKYGHEVPYINGNTTNIVLRDLNLDTSMNTIVSDFDDNLKKIGEGGIDSFMKQNRWIFTQYKNIGEEILRQEIILHHKIDLLDKLNNRMPLITSLTNNEVLPELINIFSKYSESIYTTCKLDENYLELVELYKKWNICRQIVTLHQNMKNNTNDPQCSICLTEPVSYAIVPCGHTFCSNCSKKQNTNCYMCRGIIRERIKLYFT